MKLFLFKKTSILLLISIIWVGCVSKAQNTITNPTTINENTNQINEDPIKPGAASFEEYIPLIKDKRVGIVANQGSVIFHPTTKEYIHLVDTLLELKINIVKVFSPEHGFRGTADAGESINDQIDSFTKIPILSLYGNNKKPKTSQLNNIDILVFDLQDIGVRFYTYISTLHYVMEAAAEQNIPVLVLDRPNPNADYIDGPVLKEKHSSFVGMHPVPVVYGMTIGEYAMMINGENWLQNGIKCDLKVVKNQNYTHDKPYFIPVRPSPNLPNDLSIRLYPSLCFFEGTAISVGRGTSKQFQIFGAPTLPQSIYNYQFEPKPNEGAKQPLFDGKVCYGKNLENTIPFKKIDLQWIIEAYRNFPDKKSFFNNYFNKLSGNDELKNQIELGYTESDIKKTWEKDLELFNKIRTKYLIYP